MTFCFACLGARSYYVARYTKSGLITYVLKPCRPCAPPTPRAVDPRSSQRLPEGTEPELIAVIRSTKREVVVVRLPGNRNPAGDEVRESCIVFESASNTSTDNE